MHANRIGRVLVTDFSYQYHMGCALFLSLIIIRDEAWFHHFKPEWKLLLIKWQYMTSQRNSRVCHQQEKIMATYILDERGVILATFLPRRATVILYCYPETLRHFNVHLRPIFPTRKVSQVLLLDENARLCTSACTTKAIKKIHMNSVAISTLQS